jgi:uncharacterized protein YodC (DUF2158 family)
MSEGIEPGAVVRLKSGGPSMTVSSVGDNWGEPGVWCDWFDEKQNPQTKVFKPHQLELVPPARKGPLHGNPGSVA